MKILKKLLPIATIASTACIVAPTIASCSSVAFSTDNLKFTPANQHDASDKLLTQEEIVTNYFSKTQYFMEDLAYHRLSSLSDWLDEELEQYKKEPRISNIQVYCLLSVNSINLKDKVIKRSIEGNEGIFNSYGIAMDISLSFKADYQYTYTVPPEGLGEGIEKEVDTTYYTEQYSIDIYNCFCYLYYTGFDWNIGLYLNKDLDWSYVVHTSRVETQEFRITKAGKEEVLTASNTSGNESSDSRQIEPDNYAEVLEDNFYGTIVSYYLSKVTPKDDIDK